MRRASRSWVPALLLAVAAGCHDEDRRTALWDLWPNADGSSWSYEYTARTWDAAAGVTLYATPAEVPPPPTLTQLEAMLDSHAMGSSPESVTSTYRVSFDGKITTESGVTAQHLLVELDPPQSVTRRGPPRDPLLERLWTARPDLRGKLQAAGHAPPRERAASPPEPLFLDGYAWAKAEDWIGGYGDVDREPSWKYLEADLKPGSEFTHRLLPSLTDDVFLHARILPQREVETPAGVFGDVTVCLYLVDYGISPYGDPSGVLLGYAQSLSYGTVAYAPGVGPVAGYERVLGFTGDPLPPGSGDIALALLQHTLPGS